ncbi:hypothetical protein DFH08DRAFT_826600 [Mycena albidolilacea]|uniref:Uncharacterized protein n=1 Tax=Mycena albidolilacea TaxID=1033008 RepID=A0AAD6YZN8_9AGAR|nr:hypothetical protein DFH08DRAFT_826600 [Mycena albidolilacea]
MSKADDFGVPDVDIVAAAEEAGEIGAGGVPVAPCRTDVCLAEDAVGAGWRTRRRQSAEDDVAVVWLIPATGPGSLFSHPRAIRDALRIAVVQSALRALSLALKIDMVFI